MREIDNAFSIGFDYEVVDVHGRHFNTVGKRDRAWAFHSDEAFGSSVEFTQLYVSTRRSYLKGDRLKFHVRAEVGYTDAKVEKFVIDTVGEPINLSLTRLPNFYRFKAGGSMSVRGYGFERLSNNDVGSNHIIVTASVEAEYRFLRGMVGRSICRYRQRVQRLGRPGSQAGHRHRHTLVFDCRRNSHRRRAGRGLQRQTLALAPDHRNATAMSFRRLLLLPASRLCWYWLQPCGFWLLHTQSWHALDMVESSSQQPMAL